jgi:GDP-4-dehydro-6-deoxy-D-mannose reductase
VKALITGGGGFVGRHLTALLESAGHEVQVLDLRSSHGEPAHHECDIRDFERLVATVRSIAPEWVVHLAGWSSVGLSFRNPTRAFEINAQGAVNVLEAVRGLGLAARVLIVSSGEVYGAAEGGGPIGEDTPIAPVSPYALGKACGELSALYYADRGGVDTIIARAFNHTGPGQTEIFAVPGFAKQVAEAEKGLREPVIGVGNLDVVRDFTDVRDVARAYLLLLEKGAPGSIYNVCSGRGRPLRDLAESLVSRSTAKVRIVVEQDRWRDAEIPSLVGDNSRIARDVGWRPSIPMEKTIEDTLRFWRERVGAGSGSG